MPNIQINVSDKIYFKYKLDSSKEERININKRVRSYLESLLTENIEEE